MAWVFLNVSTNEDTCFSAFPEQAFNNIIFLDLWTTNIKALSYGLLSKSWVSTKAIMPAMALWA